MDSFILNNLVLGIFVFPPNSLVEQVRNSNKWIGFSFGLIFGILILWFAKIMWSKEQEKLASILLYVFGLFMIASGVCQVILP